MNILCICSRNRLRSPTAEYVASQYPDIQSDSAGLAPDAEVVLDRDHIKWADMIFVMEKHHLKKLKQKFGEHLAGKKVMSLDIPDNYECMQPELIELLERKMVPHLKQKKKPKIK